MQSQNNHTPRKRRHSTKINPENYLVHNPKIHSTSTPFRAL